LPSKNVHEESASDSREGVDSLARSCRLLIISREAEEESERQRRDNQQIIKRERGGGGVLRKRMGGVEFRSDGKHFPAAFVVQEAGGIPVFVLVLSAPSFSLLFRARIFSLSLSFSFSLALELWKTRRA